MMNLLPTNFRFLAEGINLTNSFVVSCRYGTNLKFARSMSSSKGTAAFRRDPAILCRSGYETSQLRANSGISSSTPIFGMRNGCINRSLCRDGYYKMPNEIHYFAKRLISSHCLPLQNSQSQKWLALFQAQRLGNYRQLSQKPDKANNHEPEDDSRPYVVYDGELKRQMKHIKIFSLCTSILGLTVQPVIYNNSVETGMVATVAMLGLVGFFTYVTPFLIHQLAKKYVTEIIYDPEKQMYTAVTYSFFLQRKELNFQKGDVIVPDVPGPFTSILAQTKDGKKIPLFFALESFTYPNHYGLIMGYDKPLDLHISAEEFEAAKQKKKSATDSKKSSIKSS